MDPSTSKFLQARPFAVLPAAPALAALYTTQAPSRSTDWCSKCGSYLLHGAADIRIVRLSRKRSSARALRKACQTCAWNNDTPINKVAPVLPPKEPCPAPSPLIPAPAPAPTPSPIPVAVPPASAQTKARNKKKSGLQLMLSRNRDKEAQEKGSKDGSGGLAAFLSGL